MIVVNLRRLLPLCKITGFVFFSILFKTLGLLFVYGVICLYGLLVEWFRNRIKRSDKRIGLDTGEADASTVRCVVGRILDKQLHLAKLPRDDSKSS